MRTLRPRYELVGLEPPESWRERRTDGAENPRSTNLKEQDFMLKALMKAEVAAADNILYEVMRRMIGDTPEWQHTKPGHNDRRGCYAFLVVQLLVTGQAYVQSQINDLKKDIEKLKYSGESSGQVLQPICHC